jgi:uncharacterized LabA/DUF88 family protein
LPLEPAVKRAVAFVDGQNLFHSVRRTFGYQSPNYDPTALARAVCALRGWRLAATHFYTGVPDEADDPRWNRFWNARLAVMATRGVRTFSRALRYRDVQPAHPSGALTTIRVGREKGIDVRLALDIVRLAREDAFDVAILFSQDQDLSEVADEVRAISREHQRWIRLACAFPISPTSRNRRGIEGTEWVRIDRATYDACLDPNDYFPKPRP